MSSWKTNSKKVWSMQNYSIICWIFFVYLFSGQVWSIKNWVNIIRPEPWRGLTRIWRACSQLVTSFWPCYYPLWFHLWMTVSSIVDKKFFALEPNFWFGFQSKDTNSLEVVEAELEMDMTATIPTEASTTPTKMMTQHLLASAKRPGCKMSPFKLDRQLTSTVQW